MDRRYVSNRRLRLEKHCFLSAEQEETGRVRSNLTNFVSSQKRFIWFFDSSISFTSSIIVCGGTSLEVFKNSVNKHLLVQFQPVPV